MSPEAGRKLWAELHAMPFEHGPGPLSEHARLAVRAWLDQWQGRVAKADDGCACEQHWRILLQSRPPDLRSAGTLYLWTCRLHDAVNLRLGKTPWLALRPELERFSDPQEVLKTP